VDVVRAVDAENASTTSLENHKAVFHNAHKAILFTLNRGHFYFVKNGDISISL
jgi:hypothetical protein